MSGSNTPIKRRNSILQHAHPAGELQDPRRAYTGAKLVEYEGNVHGFFSQSREAVTMDMLEFLR